MKHSEMLKKIFGFLTIVFAITSVFLINVYNNIYINNPHFDTYFTLMWVGIVCTILLGVFWFLFKVNSDNIIAEENRIKWEEQRKIEEAKRAQKKEQQKAEMAKAYREISDIWEYGEKTMLAVKKSDDGFMLTWVELNYSPNKAEPWSIQIKDSFDTTTYKAKKTENKLIGFCKDKVIVMTRGQFNIDNTPYFFDPEHENVNYVNSLMKRLLTNKKIETVRFEHLQAAGPNALEALPKFHFTISKAGIKCDEINYPKKQIDEWFEKNNGGENMWQNRIFYDEYCKKGSFKIFPPEDVDWYNEYIYKLSTRTRKSEYSNCKTDFEIHQWCSAVLAGINKLFKSIKSYETKMTLDVTPSYISDNTIFFQRKIYPSITHKTDKSDLAREIVVSKRDMEILEELKNGNVKPYSISIVDEDILIQIKGEAFVAIGVNND